LVGKVKGIVRWSFDQRVYACEIPIPYLKAVGLRSNYRDGQDEFIDYFMLREGSVFVQYQQISIKITAYPLVYGFNNSEILESDCGHPVAIYGKRLHGDYTYLIGN
jgi:hypothetical protein